MAASLRELEAATDPLVAGVELGAVVGGVNLDDPGFEKLWATLEDRRLFTLLHPGP